MKSHNFLNNQVQVHLFSIRPLIILVAYRVQCKILQIYSDTPEGYIQVGPTCLNAWHHMYIYKPNKMTSMYNID